MRRRGPLITSPHVWRLKTLNGEIALFSNRTTVEAGVEEALLHESEAEDAAVEGCCVETEGCCVQILRHL